jgi:GNAT superfamily N-acetyltransferase
LSTITIRQGLEADLPAAMDLIQELAIYERAPHEVTNTIEEMREAGFGQKPVFGFFLAENEVGEPIGLALYHLAYSTWKGTKLYLEDLIVTERYRRQGIGKLLFDTVARHAHQSGLKALNWQVLDWNEPAIQFYRKIGAALDPEWINCKLTGDYLQSYVETLEA